MNQHGDGCARARLWYDRNRRDIAIEVLRSNMSLPRRSDGLSSLLVIAHRGASAVAPESTSAAIEQAVRANANMIELDVQRTRDGRLVVFHDDRLERTTNGRGKLVTTSYAALARLDAGSWFHPRFTGERILLVSEAIRLIPPPLTVNLELKRTRYGHALIEHLRRIVRQARVASRVLLSSFDAGLLERWPPSDVSLALICRERPDQSLRQAMALGCAAWHPEHRLVTRARIAVAHATGLRVHAWTVDDPRRARALARLGIDGVFTNDPARLRGARP